MMGKLIDNINLPRSPTQGALDGMKQLFEPEWEKMGNYDVGILQLTHQNIFCSLSDLEHCCIPDILFSLSWLRWSAGSLQL